MKTKLLVAVIAVGLLFSAVLFAQTMNTNNGLYMIPWLNNYYYPEDRNNDAYLRTSQSNFFGPVNDLLVYPNPVISNTRIVLNTLPASDVHVDIIDMNGNLVRSYKYIPGTYNLDVDMSRLPLGLYSVRVYGKDIDFHNLKVVKQGF